MQNINKLDIDIIDIEINDNIIEQNYLLMDANKTISNCFYPNLDQIKTRFNNLMSNDDLYHEFGNPYLICLKDNADFEPYYYEQQIYPAQFIKIKESIHVIQINYKIITGSIYKYITSISANIFN